LLDSLIIQYIMKQIISSFLFVVINQMAFAQCAIEPWTLNERLAKSQHVIEAKVIAQEGAWDANHHKIYTINTLQVFKTFKGNIATSTIKLATEGGAVALEMLRVSPSLELQKNDVGIFFIQNGVVLFDKFTMVYKPTASTQSFIQYDLIDVKAFDIQKSYESITGDLYNEILSYSGQNMGVISEFDPEARLKVIKPLSPPTINSFSTTTTTAGTSTELTITGNNFGATRGKGKVGFKDANYGDGRYYYSPTSWSYVTWSNTQIKILIPSRAGTGKVQVINDNAETGESTTDLTISYSHLNINYPASAVDTPFFELRHINANSAGGYTWQMNPNFSYKSAAVEAFLRSMQEWRCETQINWSMGNDISIDTIESDGINLVRFTNFTDSKLGVCYSWYGGCFVGGGDMRWYVKECDIEFDSTRNWHYGTGTPNSNQYDFESVTTHELGHGHQLGHVRASEKVMHYSIVNGQRKPELVATDIACGIYVMGKSTTTAVCSKEKMTAIPLNQCGLVKPTGNFTISDAAPCPVTTIVFTDSTLGDVISYSWDFGANALPASASTIGPHNVTYSDSGTSTIRLIVTNTFGIDTIEKMISVQPNKLVQPSVFSSDAMACIGQSTYSIATIDNALSYNWILSSGGTLTGNGSATVTVDWTDTGKHELSAVGVSECTNIGLNRVATMDVGDGPTALFTHTEMGRTATFTSTSEGVTSYLWKFGTGDSSTVENPIYTFPDQGNYTITLTTKNRCGEAAENQTVSVNFGVGIGEVDKSVSVYPNPLKNGAKLTIQGSDCKVYELYDLQGVLVLTGKVINNTMSLDVITPKVYVLRLLGTSKNSNLRIHIIE
jgi:PKD repeat protein